jgi:hypothetical protein
VCDSPCTVVLDYCFMNRFAAGVGDLSSTGQLRGQLSLLFCWCRASCCGEKWLGGEADQSPSGDELTNECGCASTYLYAAMTLTETASLFAVLCVCDLLLQSVVTFFLYKPVK